jgi:hypothetical protein
MSEQLVQLLTLGVILAACGIAALGAVAIGACVAAASILLGIQVGVRTRMGLNPIPTMPELRGFLERYVTGREQTAAAVRQQPARSEAPAAAAAGKQDLAGDAKKEEAAPKARYF